MYIEKELPFDVFFTFRFWMHLHFFTLHVHRDIALYIALRARRRVFWIRQYGPFMIVLSIYKQDYIYRNISFLIFKATFFSWNI